MTLGQSESRDLSFPSVEINHLSVSELRVDAEMR